MSSCPSHPTTASCLQSALPGLVAGIVSVVLLSPVWGQDDLLSSPTDPRESLKWIETHPGVQLELVACEPQVVDPVAIAFGADGVLWVVEMSDYPLGPAGGEPPRSRIKCLFDPNRDGFYEESIVFADKLLFANGIQPWRDGVIVTMAGQVAFLRDTDGDHRCDETTAWFTGFVEENPQLRANHPTLGLDNRIYVSNGLRGGTVVAAHPEWKARQPEPVSISGLDFRFDPLTGHAEAVSGVGQFGLTFDDYGHRFVCSNRNPNKQIVVEQEYLRRNPQYSLSTVYHDVSPAAADSRVFAINRPWTTSTLHAGQFTAACGVCIYRGDELLVGNYGDSFTCEPTGGLVHRDSVFPAGPVFDSQYATEGREFLASRDDWFRPVNLANAPDGCLYVVDMYRAVIEHPQFMPDELKSRADLTNGSDRGRIYRVMLAGGEISAERRHVDLTGASPNELVHWLESRNAWHRETAQRLLVERQDRSAVDALQRLVRSSSSHLARIHGLWTLEGLHALEDETLLVGMADSHPRVVEQALRLGERRYASSGPLTAAAVEQTRSDSAAVQFQVLLSSLLMPDSARQEIVSRVVRTRRLDEWTIHALLLASGQDLRLLLDALPDRIGSLNDQTERLLVHQVTAEAGRRLDAQILAEYLETWLVPAAPGTEASEAERWLELVLVGIGDGLVRRGQSLSGLIMRLTPEHQARLERVWERGLQRLENNRSEAEVLAAIELLKHADFQRAGQPLLGLVENSTAQSIRLAALAALGRMDGPEVASRLIAGFPSQTPAIRRAILDCLLARSDRTVALLDALEGEQIAVGELGITNQNRLLKHRDAAIRARANQVAASRVSADRAAVIKDYAVALTGTSDPLRGKTTFAKNCAQCHRIGEQGVDVAPDIADSRTKTPAALLTAILDPNQAIDNNYFSYTVVTNDGKVLTGIIAEETTSSITLKQPEGKVATLLRSEIDELRANGVSLMPEGFEKNISVQEMGDLISYIKNWRYLDGRTPIEIPGARPAKAED